MANSIVTHSSRYPKALAAGALAMKVPGQIRSEEAAFLFALARRHGNLVEIGCLYGRSTVALLKAAEAYKAHVTSIDPFIPTVNTNELASEKTWTNHIKNVGLEPQKLLVMKSHEAAKLFNEEIAFIFIDGGHGYKTVKQDIEDWLPKVKVSGIVAFHDLFLPHASGPTRAISEWWLNAYDQKNPLWKLIGTVAHTVAFRKVR